VDRAVQNYEKINAPVETSNGLAQESMKINGSLDPAFVEYLMGYPIGWTVLKPLGIR
jgi:hypothetical protein